MSHSVQARAEKIISNKKIINVIRHNDILDLKSVVQHVESSWPTVKNSLENLINNGLIIDDKSNSLKRFIVNKDYCFFLGIAIGATETKISIVDFSLSPVNISTDERFAKLLFELELKLGESLSENCLCYSTQQDYLGILTACTTIIETVVDFFQGEECVSKNLELMAIGISLPGIVDKNTGEMTFCPNIPSLIGMPVDKMIKGDTKEKLHSLGITYSFCHDTVAATVFEKEWLYSLDNPKRYLKDKKNIALFYLGFGFGSGYIFDNRLVLGASGAIGELGHVDVECEFSSPQNDKELDDQKNYIISNTNIQKNLSLTDPLYFCTCGNMSCFERLIRMNVFNSCDVEDFKKKTKIQELKNFSTNHPYRYNILKILVSKALNITVNMLNVDIVILSGKILNQIPELKNDVETAMNLCTLKASSKYCSIINGCPHTDVVALGAATLSYYNLISSKSNNQKLSIDWN